MTIETSKDYKADISTKRLFKALTEDSQQLCGQIDALLTAANAMRRTIASAMLGIAQIEALYVDSTEERRKLDSEMYAATEKIAALVQAANSACSQSVTAIIERSNNVVALNAQTERIATDRFMAPELPSDVPYVGIEYLVEKLGVSMRTVRRYQAQGLIDPPDAVDNPEDGGGQRQLWAKPTADKIVSELLDVRAGSKKAMAL